MMGRLKGGKCGCPEMESYEEFCLRSLVILQEGAGIQKKTCEPLWSLKARSVIRFHGRAVLSPLLSAEQRSEMHDHRRRAVQLEVKRQNQQRNNLLAQVQDILGQAQAHTSPSDCVKLPVSKSSMVSGYTLVTDSPGFGVQMDDQTAHLSSETPVLNGYKAVEDVKVEREEKSDEEEDDDEDISLDSLLKRSREYVKKEQSQHGSKVVCAVTRTPPPETSSDKKSKSCSPIRDTGIEFGFSLHHSPIGPPQTQIQHQNLYERSPQQPVCLSPSLPDRYAHLPSPESSISPCPQRRKPRPVSTGNIHFSFPIGPADVIPRTPGRSGECPGMADRREALSGATKSSDPWGSMGSEGASGISKSGNGRSSHSGTSPVQEICSPGSASGLSPKAYHDPLVAGFRRRCHTLDNQLNSYHSGAEHIDRSQERVPRFMAGVTWMASSRRTLAAPLNQSYEIDNPVPSLRPRMNPDLAQVTPRTESDDHQGTNNGRITPTVFRNTTEIQTNRTTAETQRRAQALEDMQRRLEEEHAMQMSLLLAEQEKEQQRLLLLEETERRLEEQDFMRPLSGDTCGWTSSSVNDSCPIGSPSCLGLSPVHTPSERSPGHSRGFPSPISSNVSPSVQPPVYLWGPTWVVSKPRARLSLVLTTEQQTAFCRIGALIRGFLTRRLLKTEKVKHLCQTIVDTQEFIHSFQTEAPQKKSTYSAQDRSLQERVRAQLRAALYDIHDIFFEMPLGDRLALLQQDRELQAERKLRDLEKTKCPKERVVLSAATQRSLDRKKRVGESPAQTRKVQQKPKSPTTNRVLKPSQGQNAAVPGQLNRQGSWYRRTPEERVRRSDSLKKQHSLG